MPPPRIAPLDPPYEPEIAEALAKWMPPGSKIEPLKLFRTLMRSPEISSRLRALGVGNSGPAQLDRSSRAGNPDRPHGGIVRLRVRVGSACDGLRRDRGADAGSAARHGQRHAAKALTRRGPSATHCWCGWPMNCTKPRTSRIDLWTALVGALGRAPIDRVADHRRHVSHDRLRGEWRAGGARRLGRAISGRRRTGRCDLVQIDIAPGRRQVGIFLGLFEQLVKFLLKYLSVRFFRCELICGKPRPAAPPRP